uniref:Uncharacterized protein LOC111102150 n=1 Tax=Crassostrea virginica TaxID=6565 RepID=A0A8B8AHW1_CRAVI|nr:uncharacterized protein LOC111102150 [Crassostrea virginica]
MTRILLCFLAMNPVLVYGYLGITYNLQDCTEIPPVAFCGRSAKVSPPLVFYFYHPSTGQCEPFLWSDCPNAHSNNVFSTKDQCEAICRDPLTVPGVADSEAQGRGRTTN